MSLRTATLRVVGFYVSGFVFGIGFIRAAFDPKRQGWHDKFADTQVIQVNRVGAVRVVLALTFLVIAGILSIPGVFIQGSVQNFKMQGTSMGPALEHGEYILVNKLAYKFGDPKPGDVVVFRYPDPNPKNRKRDFVKRVIGVPGDKISINKGTVWVNGKPLAEDGYIIAPGSTNMSERKMGQEEYFVLGDDRPHSNDSREWGAVPEENILGKVWIVYWPPR